MVDGRVFYQTTAPELDGYLEIWENLKSSLFSASEETKQLNYSENPNMQSYDLDPELKGDIESVKGAAENFENLGKSTEYGNSHS